MVVLKVLDVYGRQRAILRSIPLPVEGWLTLMYGLVAHSVDMAHCLHRRILVEDVNRGHDEMHAAVQESVARSCEAVNGRRMKSKDGGKWVLPGNRASLLLLQQIIVESPRSCLTVQYATTNYNRSQGGRELRRPSRLKDASERIRG